MTRDVADALAQHYDRFSVERPLHQVPPHETYVVSVDGRRAVCKRATGPTGDPATEGRVMRFVGRTTDVPVPEVLAVGTDHFVAAWHPGAPDPEADRADEAWARAAGRCLGALHAETAPAFDGYGRPEPTGDGGLVAAGPDWHATACRYLRERREVVRAFGYADVADAVLAFLTERPDAFDGTGDPVLCHGWATPEHVAVEDGEATCVLDFEHALVAPGEWDYWRTVLPAFQHADDSEEADADVRQRAFRAGYESVRPLPDGVERRRPLYELLNTVYYLESLFVQRNVPADERGDRAALLADHVHETLADLREGP